MKQYKNYRFKNKVIRQWYYSYPDDTEYVLLYNTAYNAFHFGINCEDLPEEDANKQMAKRFAKNHGLSNCNIYVYDKFIWYIVKAKNNRKTIIGLKKIPKNRRLAKDN